LSAVQASSVNTEKEVLLDGQTLIAGVVVVIDTAHSNQETLNLFVRLKQNFTGRFYIVFSQKNHLVKITVAWEENLGNFQNAQTSKQSSTQLSFFS
jgi:hypothetical protein